MYKNIRSLVKVLKEKGITLALAESVTCGLAVQKMSTCQGISEVLTGSIICYTPDVKMNLLGVKKSVIERYTCESEQVTEALVNGLKRLIKADVYAAITGLASPGGSETTSKPVGTIFFSLSYDNRIVNSRSVFKGSPLQIREQACNKLYSLILSEVKKH